MLLHSASLQAVEGLAHAWTTRSAPERVCRASGLDLGPAAAPGAWDWLAVEVGLPGAPVALLSQVHGAVVHEVDTGGLAGEGDALITRRPGLLLAIRVADCVPVLVADLDAAGRVCAVAAAHAGWRGLAAQVLPATLERLGPPRGRRLAAVGPCIGVDAYEVGPEVIEGIGAVVPHTVFVRPGRRAGHWQADLRAAAAWQLRQGGCSEVEVGPWCTWTDPALHSHRRDAGAAGRLAAVIGWKA